MPSWKQVNEVGGTVILRGMTGLIVATEGVYRGGYCFVQVATIC
jgi:hypothetical protein